MRFTQVSLVSVCRYSTNVHEKSPISWAQNQEDRASIKPRIAFWGLAESSSDFKTVSFHLLLWVTL